MAHRRRTTSNRASPAWHTSPFRTSDCRRQRASPILTQHQTVLRRFKPQRLGPRASSGAVRAGMHGRLRDPRLAIRRFLNPFRNTFTTRPDGTSWAKAGRTLVAAPKDLEGLALPGKHKTLRGMGKRSNEARAHVRWGVDEWPLERLVEYAHARWMIEQFHREATQKRPPFPQVVHALAVELATQIAEREGVGRATARRLAPAMIRGPTDW